jgi:phage replication O-like protein O
MKLTPPNYTQTPNDLFDHWLPHLSESELKVLLVVLRKTFGWHKSRDRISISQLARITGLTRETVIHAGKTLQNKGIITREVVGPNGKQETYYELVIIEESNNSYPSDEPTPPSRIDEPPPPVGLTDPQKKPPSTKETSTTSTFVVVDSFSSQEKTNNKQPNKTAFSEDDAKRMEPYTSEQIAQAHEITQTNCIQRNNKSRVKFFFTTLENLAKSKETTKKLTVYEELSLNFKHGHFYNNAECLLNSESIAFQRGMKHEQIAIQKFWDWDKFNAICESFGIKFRRKK